MVNDAQLLFTGDLKRSGLDLVLSKDDHELVLQDYFKGEKRAALASPDGAHLTGDIVNALTGYTQYAQAGAVEPPKVIGHVSKLTGSATAVRNGVAIVLNQGDNVLKGDVVQAGADSTLGLTFIDGTVFGLGPNAKMVLNEMVYDPNGSNNSSLMSLVQGTISFVAGATAKHGDMKVDTPVATMGIRGTAVLVEIDFTVPAQGGAPPASFQVLVEPDGTTGSYILFDKTTLNPIATVDQAGTQTVVNGQGTVSFLTTAPLSADAQKIIADVFALKFTDNSNPNTKLASNFTDSVVPTSTTFKLLSGDVVVPTTIVLANFASTPGTVPVNAQGHVALAPTVVVTQGTSFNEQLNLSHSQSLDSVSGIIKWADINLGDHPTASASFTSFSYLNADNVDVTSSLTAAQLAAIKAVEVPLQVEQAANNLNIGSATWTYSLPDGAFDFLAAGETLTLTYTVAVDNNFAQSRQVGFQTFTITITGTNDVPAITSPTQAAAITEFPGVTGSATPDTAHGVVAFIDPDLTDTHSVTVVALTESGVTTGLADEATVLSWLSLGALTDATNGVTGSRSWTFSAADNNFDYLAAGETLTLTYLIQVDDHHGGVVTQPITITIIGTNDAPVITSPTQVASIVEIPGVTGSTKPDTASGLVTFTDVDLSDTHNVTVAGVTESGVTDGLPDQATILSWLSLGALTDSTNGVTGYRSWTFSAADKDFDYLAAGETLTLTYVIQVDDHHGGVVDQLVTIGITGTNDVPVITSPTQAAAITEIPGVTGSTTPDTAHGTVTFTDVDLSDTHSVTITGLTESGVTNGLPDQAIMLSWLSLGALTDSTNGVTGSRSWTFSAADKDFDYLAAGETLTLTYMIQVDDHHGGVVNQPITITITGTNDVPVITSPTQAAAITEIPGVTGSTTPDCAHGTVTFTDVDLSDTHSVTISGVTESGVTSGLDLDAVQSWLTLGKLTDSTGGVTGSDGWTFSAPDKSFDYLAAGETLTLTYMIEVDDHHGGVVTQPVTITITGTNDVPVITSPTQAAAITEIPGVTGSTTPDTAHGAVTFTDADRSDTHSVCITGVTESGVTTGLDVDAVQSWLTLGKLTDSTGGGTGSDCWTFSAPDKSFDYLAAGAKLTLTYTIQVDDHHGGVVTQPVTITITGTNDVPVITSSAQTGSIIDIAHTTGSSTPDTASGAVTFTDADLSDTHCVTITGVTESGATSGLACQSAVLSWLTLGTLTDSTGGATGSDAWTFAAADKNFDYLVAGQTVTLTYNVEVNDHHGGVVDQAVTITVTGSDKSPAMSFTTLDATGDCNSQATGINDAGIVVGQADATSTHQVGWSYNGSTFSAIVVPDDGTENGYAQDTSAHAINNFDVVAGDYSPVRSTPRYGFVDNNGDFSKIASDSPYPSTNANGINDAGIVVGSDYLHGGAHYTGYADDHGTFIYYNAPGTDNRSGDTFVNGINNHNDVVGSYSPDFTVAADYKGFVYDGENFTTIADPLGANGTFAQGINDAGEVVGYYVDANNQKHGFIDNGGVFTTVDDALGVHGTVLNGINNAGAVVGYYVDANNVTHGFVANPTVTITVVTPNGLDFQADNPLKQMGDGAVHAGGSSTTYTVVDSSSNHEFVVDGTGFTYNADGALTGGIITSFHEFTAGDSPVAIADFTGLSVYAPTWMSAVQQDAAGDNTAIDALTGNYSYVLNAGSGNVNFGSAGHADTLVGTGRDIFDGGGAAAGSHDTLTGGAGSTFVFGAGYGALTITNFDQASGAWDPNEADHIQLNGLSAPLNVNYADGNALLDFGKGDIITLLNVTQTQYENLHGSEFTSGNGGGPVLNSVTLTVGEDDTTVLNNSDFNVTDSAGYTDFTYTVSNVVGGQFEVYNGESWSPAPTGGFTTEQIAEGKVEFVQDGTSTVPSFLIHASDPNNAGADIAANVTLEISGSSSETVTFAGSTGTLLLDDAADFSGKIAGIVGTGNVLDLAGFDAANDSVTASTGPGSFDSDSGTTSLVVTDHTTDKSVTLKLAGDLSNSTWTVSSDNNGGANIVDPPAIAATVPVDHQPAASSTIVANAPNQTMTGTGASNTFVFDFAGIGHDTVTNFNPSTDSLLFHTGPLANAQAILNAIQDDGHGNTVINIDASDAIVLSGVVKAQLHASDFHFG